MNSMTEVCAVIRRCTYKPGTRIDAFEEAEELRISFYVSDTVPPNEKIHISMTFRIPPPEIFQNEMSVIKFVINAVDIIEQHETREWFRFDGGVLLDPHSSEHLLMGAPK